MVLNKLFHVCFVMVFVALFFSGIHITNEPIKIVPYDLVLLFFTFVMILRFLAKGRMRLPMSLRPAMAISSILLIWLGLQALRSPDIGRALTLFVIAIRDVVTMVLVAIGVANWRQKMDNINRVIFTIGVFVTAIALILFLLAISDPNRIIAEPRPGLIYRAGEGLFPHMQGFSHNPIYYATLVLLSLISGATMRTGSKIGNVFELLGLTLLLLAAVASFQRGPLIAFVLGAVLTGLIAFLHRKPRQLMVKFLVRLFLIILFALPILVFAQLPGYEITLLERVIFRLQEARWDLRYDYYWSQLVPAIYESPFIGYGLRSAELKLGNAVENSYLDILHDHGIIGLLCWTAFLWCIFLVSVTKMRVDPSILTWSFAWTVMLISMGYISMQYDPLTWVVAGIIVGWRTQQVQSQGKSYAMPAPMKKHIS